MSDIDSRSRGTRHHRVHSPSRSRSPYSHDSRRRPRSRSPLPRKHHHHHHHRHHGSTTRSKSLKPSSSRSLPEPVVLPLGAPKLSKHSFQDYKPLFALYLDVQKQLLIEDLDEREVRGRWKAFVGKWNRGELLEGWYDPTTNEKAIAASKTSQVSPTSAHRDPIPEEEADADDEFGPSLPSTANIPNPKHGPAIPSFQDLSLRHEAEEETQLADLESLRRARKEERKFQKDQLDELIPKAEAGTRERQLEKKRELAASNREFARERSPDAVEVSEADLLGGGDGLEDVKRIRKEHERKKNEREIRREEVLRARAKEREERAQEYRVKEGKTMEMLRGLAKERFG
ncbi:MAG: hypothetical protein M1834_002432 [Cirrosporium novae-zelandiae]|nr:MAG: hypothetical protein M1834_002432 [Cirrosporium novae-zelandiae]